MIASSPLAGRDTRAADGLAFCTELAEEIRAIAAGDTAAGEGLVWMIAALTAGQPGLDHACAVQRLVAALLVETGPIVWDHVRSSPGGSFS